LPPDRLLAKSANHGRKAQTIARHTADVLAAARGLTRACGAELVRALGLPAADRDRLERDLAAGAALHDGGKGGDHFQEAVRFLRGPDRPQGLYHEAVSYLLLRVPALRDWLGNRVNDPVRWAVAGHHRRFPPSPRDGAGTRLVVYASHPDFAAWLRLVAKELGLPDPPVFDKDLVLDLTAGGVFADLDLDWVDAEAALKRAERPGRAFAACLKAALICADVAGSAGVDPGVLDEGLDPSRLGRVVEDRLEGRPVRPFQEAVAAAPTDAVLVLAGCGTGKTLAAYLRGVRRYPGRRLLFCYPTTGTTTEGFRDYLLADGLGSALIHSRARVDWRLLGLGEEESQEAVRAAVEGLGLWSCHVASCTVDTVLGLLQNNRRGVYAFPVIAGSVVVFDEIHGYDPRLFRSLLRFLREFPGVPVVLMTASLQAGRRRQLEEALGDRLSVVRGPEDLETVPRYRLSTSDATGAIARARSVLARGGKVLWVCNRVGAAQQAYRSLSGLGHRCELYHSRYRYRDRVDRHGAVIEAFRGAGPVVAVTTQVCEQSLDLDADLLVTELAPVWALIQRLGRLNRFAPPDGSGGTRDGLVIEPSSPLPYAADDLERARAWFGVLGDRPLSQRDLARTWEAALEEDAPPPEVSQAWLDGGFVTRPDQVREASPGLLCLLPEDAPRVRDGGLAVEEVSIPMALPRGLKPDGWARVAYCLVPPRGALVYDREVGGRWSNSGSRSV
jgi:CRISPR-associated endonuclease/helicase Cas3